MKRLHTVLQPIFGVGGAIDSLSIVKPTQTAPDISLSIVKQGLADIDADVCQRYESSGWFQKPVLMATASANTGTTTAIT